jgi:hypothetical protein
LNNPEGREDYRALGVRALPVLYKDGKFVLGQNIEDVARFIGLSGSGLQALPPEQLIIRWILVLQAAQRFMLQISDAQMQEWVIPNRDREIWRLCYHIFRIPEAFLETAVDGAEFTAGSPTREPPPGQFTTAREIASYGESVITRLNQWWEQLADKSCQLQVQTYFGLQTTHMLYERCTWHSAQHVRQMMAVVERFGLKPDGPLTSAQLAGLPLPERLWE